MAESKKGTSTVGNPKEKDPMLDLDFGNDFLTSWKTTSVTGDDAMDLDFGPISKGNKKAFDFKKGDMDFNLDDDFGKMPSFDLGITSPIKKDANSKKKHEESTTGNNKAKADHFSFGFDFDDLGSFSFKSSPKKQGAKEKKDEAKENSPDISGSKESADHTPEENETTKNLSTQGKAVLITSSFVSQVGNDAATGATTGNHLSNTNDKGQLSPTTAFDKTSAYEELTAFDQTLNTDKQHSDSQLHKVSPEQVSQETCIPTEPALDVSAISISAAEPSKENMPKVQEDDDSVSILISQGDKQCFDKNEKDNSFSSSVSPVHGDPSSQYGLSPQNANGSLPNSVDVHTYVGKKDEPKHTQTESLSGQSSTSVVLKEFAPSKHDQMKAQNLLDHSTVTIHNAVSANNMMPEKEKEALTVRSKYFKAADKSGGDQLHNALTQRKLSSLTEKKIVDRQQHLGDERQGNAKEDQNEIVIPDKSLARLESRISTEHSDKESQDGSQSLLSRGSLSEDKNKGKLVSRGRDSNAKTLASIRLTGQAENLRFKNGPNSETLAPKVSTEQIKPSLTILQSPNLSSLRISRPTATNTDGSKPLPRDNIKSSTLNQNRVLVGVKPSKYTAPPIHSLKRKRVESPNTNVISKSPKLLFPSPVLRQTEENPTDHMDEEALGNKNKVGNGNVYTPNSLKSWEANRIELEVPYSMEKDDNVEKAEAITKEIDNICNMLRKKHEEAKEILVRAVVSNNKLLMLNHPMHDEKICMVQRFAKQLSLKEIDTQT